MSKNSQGFVLVVGLGIKQNQVKPAADLAGKSCKQVRDILGFAANEILAIRSPLFVRTLKNDEVPLKLFPQLVIKERPTKYSFPDYCLMQFDESKQNTFTIFVKPVVKDVEEIPPFRATIEVTKELTSAKMMKIIDESFKMEHTNAKILNFNEKTKVKDVLKIVKSKRIEMQCELTESAKKKMATRRSIIREIETTEESYISGLQTIMDVWQPRMVKSGKFTEAELGMMFKQFPGIIRCHSLFLEQLKARGCDFKADISDIFLDFADFFKVSAPYISNYAALIGMLAGKRKGNDESLFTLDDGREFSSFLITPVQRMPRYILFLRELMKVTPESHPDYRALEGASAKIQNVTMEMDEATKQAGNANEIMELQQMLTKPVNLLLAGRVILKSVQIDSLKNGGKIYLIPYLIVDYFARNTIKKTGKMFYQYGLYKPLVNKKLGSPATIRQFFPLAFVLGLIFGLILSILIKYILISYVVVVTMYFLLALMFSLKSYSSISQVMWQIATYFTIHLNYGWGYLVGIYKILTKTSFQVKVNR